MAKSKAKNIEPEFQIVKTKTKTRIVNADCPYGYTFCYEKKPARDKRYCQEWTCNWLFGSKGPIEALCLEMMSM